MPTGHAFTFYARAAMIGMVYFVAAAGMMALTRYSNGIATVWIAAAIPVAALAPMPRRHWWPTIIACWIGGYIAIGIFGLGWIAAIAMAPINVAEGVLGAYILQAIKRHDSYLDTPENVGIFGLAACLLPSAATGFPAALVVSLTSVMQFGDAYRMWVAGHALGTLTFAPILTLLMSGEIAASLRDASARRRIESGVLLLAMIVIAALVFSQQRAPLLFLPTLPLIIMTLRRDRAHTALAIVILAVVGGALTLIGRGPTILMAGTTSDHAQLFQIYLAVTVVTFLPVAADLLQRKQLFRRLMESEARYKLITESSTDIILTLNVDGTVRYASPSLREITGYDPAMLIGKRPDELINGPDARAANAAYARAFANPQSTAILEYRAIIASGEIKWFEAHTRGIFDASGNPSGWVSAIRDISQRKSLELRLAHAAATDSLTGLANRRAFDAVMDRKIDDRRANRGQSCIAIFDIDFFKRVNDQHGHAVGDLVLESFAKAAQSVLRAGDHLARMGGEEFGVIMDGADLRQAERICDRLRETVAQSVTITPEGDRIAITVSAGIASIDGNKSRLQIMRAADDALYRAKAEGRDRLAFAA